MSLSATAHIMDIEHILVSITSEYITLLSTKKGFKFPGMMVLTVLFKFTDNNLSSFNRGLYITPSSKGLAATPKLQLIVTVLKNSSLGKLDCTHASLKYVMHSW
jgi:hypothetical protein